jgi:isocitrate dehydrogenase
MLKLAHLKMRKEIINMTNTTRTIPFIPGDGIGPEIMNAARSVIDAAVYQAYEGSKKIKWLSFQAGKMAFEMTGSYLPDETIEAIRKHKVGIKGPLTTPIGGGIRSLNVALRQALDLYVCLRPVRWLEGLPSPHRSPQGIDLAIFRENIEDLYTGIEYEPGTPLHLRWMQAFSKAVPEDYKKIPYPQNTGIGIKPISKPNSQRLVHAALQWALDNGRKRVTLVHKGNIMKYTEGSFLKWGYQTAETAFSAQTYTKLQHQSSIKKIGVDAAEKEKEKALSAGKVWVDDVIADVVFEQLITRPQNFDVIATTNLNGDYISDAAAALVGGVGISPGANINFTNGTALFEANHGSADNIAGMDKANPSSLLLSAEMMLRYIGWDTAAELLLSALTAAIKGKQVTFDLAAQLENASVLGTQAFSDKIISNIQSEA